MARLQILQLPEGASDDRPPFALVIDQVDDEAGAEIAHWPDNIATRIGARCILVFDTTIDIPANEIPVGPDSYPLHVRVEPDFAGFREQVQAEAAAASNTLTGARYIAQQYSGPSAAEQRIELARQALAADGYFTAAEIGDDIAPRITELLAHRRDEIQGHKAKLEAVGSLHKRVEHRGQTICGHCSALDDQGTTDNAPVAWPCDTIKAATGYTGEPEAGERT